MALAVRPETQSYRLVDSPIGPLTLTGYGQTVTSLSMHNQKHPQFIPSDWVHDSRAFSDAVAQLTLYFNGKLTTFDVDLELTGTEFQLKVWDELSKIPYGETISYGEQAWRVGNPKASRAVGLANGRNPVAIIIPCHRVIGANKKLTGFGGGLDRKAWLLDHERAHS